MFVLLFALFLNLSNSQDVEEREVLIFGAGMTGIAAGHVLSAAGLNNFTILEAQGYIGGRTHTIPFGSKNRGLNIGASWISGSCYDVHPKWKCEYDETPPTEVNPMLTLALKYGIQFASTDIHEWESYPPFINGTGGINDGVIPVELVSAEYNRWDAAQLCLWPLIDLILVGLKEDVSYYDGLHQCLWREPLNLIQKTIQWDEFNLEFAINIHNYSLANSELDSYYLYGNQDLFITDPRGYQGIVLNYAWEYLNQNDLDNDPRIELHSPVTLIEYDQNGGVTATVTKHDGTTKKYHAKYGLVTFSVGVLKGKHQEIVKFSPPLPSWKQDVIDLNYMADYSAVYIEWANDWWRNTHPEIDTSNIDVMVDDTYGYLPWFLNLNHPTLIPNSFIWRFDITEETAVKFQTQSTEETIQQLKNDKFSKYWNINDIPDPVSVFVGNNTINPYIQGAYSALPVGYKWRKENPKLQSNVADVLYFGGEASDTTDSGYVHSAYFEGTRVGNQILACLGEKHDNNYSCQKPYNPSMRHEKKRRRKHRRKGKGKQKQKKYVK